MTPGDELVLTREDLVRLRPRPSDIADAIRLYDEQRREERATASAQERLVVGAFGSWFKRRWKLATGIIGGAIALATGTVKGWEGLQEKAEQAVLERQATEKQAEAVEENTRAVGDVVRAQEDLGKRVGKVEKSVDAQSQINEVLLELQLRDPRTQRLIKSDNALRSKVDAIPGVHVQD